jgi:translocator protein
MGSIVATHVSHDRSIPRWVAWLGFVLLCNGAGYLSSLAARESAIYERLVRPDWAPPGWVFGPVWTALYTLMGTATYLIWSRCSGRARRTALVVFGVQLALNMMWTPVFFGLERYGLAAVVIACVLAAVTAMLVVYVRRVRLAGVLIAPLWLWVAFASALNVAIWWLNR